MGVVVYLDTILIPVSLFLIVGYHGYLCHSIKNRPSSTTYGIDKLRRTTWFLNLNQGGDKKGTLAVQTLRNALISTIIVATVTILVNIGLAALTNNAYNASHLHHLFSSAFFGSKADRIHVLKYASASLCLVINFLCSSLAVGYLVDANFLMNAPGDFLPERYTKTILERGFVLALIANRLLCSTVPLLLWMLGPFPVFLSSLALVWGLHQLDFVSFPK